MTVITLFLPTDSRSGIISKIRTYIDRDHKNELRRNNIIQLSSKRYTSDFAFTFGDKFEIDEIINYKSSDDPDVNYIGYFYVAHDFDEILESYKVEFFINDEISIEFGTGKILLDIIYELGLEHNLLERIDLSSQEEQHKPTIKKELGNLPENKRGNISAELDNENKNLQNKYPIKPNLEDGKEAWFKYYHERKQLHLGSKQFGSYTLADLARDIHHSASNIRKDHMGCSICAQIRRTKKGT